MSLRALDNSLEIYKHEAIEDPKCKDFGELYDHRSGECSSYLSDDDKSMENGSGYLFQTNTCLNPRGKTKPSPSKKKSTKEPSAYEKFLATIANSVLQYF